MHQKLFIYGLRKWLPVCCCCFFLLGCKPKEITLTGQVFTSTPVGTIKLGDAQIYLVEKSRVVEFLEKKQAAISSESAKRKLKFENANNELLSATTAYANFIRTKPFQTNSDFVGIVSDRGEFLKQIADLEQKYEPLRTKSEELRKAARSAQTERTPEFVYLDYLANSIFSPLWSNVTISPHQPPLKEPFQIRVWRSFLEESQKEMSETKSKVIRLQSECQNLQARMSQIERTAEAAQKNQVSIAKSHVESAKAAMLKFPGRLEEIVLKDFPTETTIKTVSDADGNFIVNFPSKKIFALFAKAEWKSKSESLTYCWLVDVPKEDVAAGPLLLSNSKLVEVDPDGYLTFFKNQKMLCVGF